MRFVLTLLILTAGCVEESKARLTWESVEADCDELIYDDSYVIVTVDEPEAVVRWYTESPDDAGEWVPNPGAALLVYDQFVLTSAEYCPSGSRLRLNWLW